MRGFLLLSVIVLISLLIGCNCWENTVTSSATPTRFNPLHPASQTVFIEISTRYFGTDSERCDYFFYVDGPWNWEYFPNDHHMVIHYWEHPDRSIRAAHVLVGYAKVWSGSIGSGYATDVFDIAHELPNEVDVLEDARIVKVDIDGSILIEIAGQEYTLAPGESWNTSENTIFDERFFPFHSLRETDYEAANCQMQITYSVTNHGLLSLNRIWMD